MSRRHLFASTLVALFFACAFIPIAFVIYGSLLTASPGAPQARFTFENWRQVYLSLPYLTAFWNTIAMSAVVATLSLAIGGALSWLVGRTDLLYRDILALLLVVPLFISTLVTTLAWIALAAPNAGFINASVRSLIGVRSVFDIYSLKGIVLVDVLHYSSFVYLSLFAALRSIDASLEEASFMLGAGPLTTSLKMTGPLLAPSLATVFLIVFLLAAENFAVPTLLGAPVGFQTLPSLIYQNMAIAPARPTLAAASGVMLLWIALIGAALQRRINAKAKRFVTISGKGTRFRRSTLGHWRWPAVIFVGLYLCLALLLPYLALIAGSFMRFLTSNVRISTFTLENYRTIFVGDNVRPVVVSLLLSIGGGLCLAAVYFSIAAVRGALGPASRRLLDYAVVIPSAIPALVLGIGLIWTFVGWSAPIYGTAGILLIAYFLRFLGYGVRQASESLDRIGGELSEAARMCGASPRESLRDVSLPLARPAVLSLWTMLFIFVFMEISATILLYAPQTRTMPTVLWTYMGSGSQTTAFAVAVIQASVVFVTLVAANLRLGLIGKNLER